jgi:hypothetical protein
MEGYIICPQCGSSLNDEQPNPVGVNVTVEYSCGNKVDVVRGDKVDDVITDHKICKTRIDWENILVPFSGEFDESAKLIDERFFGWTELQFYRDIHRKKWANKHQGKSCTDPEFLDKYFSDKEGYLKSVKMVEDMNFYNTSPKETFTKDYEDWIGEVTIEKVEEKIIERHGEEIKRLIYRVITAESEQYEGGYIVEHNPIGGADKSRDFYHRNILDIIIEKEKVQ